MANSSLQRSRTAGSTKTKFTMSMWVKKSANNARYLLVNYTDDSNRGLIQFGGSDEFLFQSKYSNSNNAVLQTNRKFRDVSALYNFVLIGDSTLATAGDRLKLYVNGVRETSFASNTQISQNGDFYLNEATTNGFRVGEKGDGSDFFDGYISHFVFLDGVAAAYTEFGETDSTSGIWKFKSPSGLTFGTNGVHLKFENSSNLGLDSSSNTNNMSVNGNLRQALDTPSNVYCTMNPLDNQNQGSTFTIGNNKIEYNTNNKTNFATFAVNEGKWYWEMKFANNTGGNDAMIGVVKEIDRDGSDWVGHDAIGWSYYASNGSKYTGGSGSSYGNSWTTNDIIGIAFDADTRTLWFSKNGVWQNSATISEIAAGTTTNSAFSGIGSAGEYFFPAMSGYDGNKVEFNFGNGYFSTTAISSAGSNGNGSLFEYDVPSGFYALNTKNINTYG